MGDVGTRETFHALASDSHALSRSLLCFLWLIWKCLLQVETSRRRDTNVQIFLDYVALVERSCEESTSEINGEIHGAGLVRASGYRSCEVVE